MSNKEQYRTAINRVLPIIGFLLFLAILGSILKVVDDRSKNDSNDGIIELMKKANAGDVKAQLKLGYSYFSGTGVLQDYEQAAGWYTKAATIGDSGAQYKIGLLYYNGQIERDYSKAAKWFVMAADQNVVEAQLILGSMYYNGQGVEKDFAKSIHYYAMAAKQNRPEAYYELGKMYEIGIGTIEDYTEAYKWYLLAAVHGKNVTEHRNKLREEMTKEQIVEAQKRAKAYIDGNKQSITWLMVFIVTMIIGISSFVIVYRRKAKSKQDIAGKVHSGI